MFYRYGMKVRGFSPMCQPMNGFVRCLNIHWEDEDIRWNRRDAELSDMYFDVIEYDRALTEEECADYQLADLQRHFWIIEEADGNFVAEYDSKEDAEYDLNEFNNSDMASETELRLVELRTCPCCGKVYSKYPAISRVDNETLICPDCGIDEAIGDWITQEIGSPEWKQLAE